MNLRVGPDRVGPAGSLLSVVHGLKVLMKEDFTPTGADSIVFTWAPVVVFLTAVMTFLVIPFGPGLVGADLNIGLLYLFAIGGMTVVGLLMAGWSSFNKYSLLGGLRSAAQVVSYEIPLTLSVVGLILLAGTMSVYQIGAAAVRLVHRLVRVPPAAGRADLLHRRHRGGQPDPVRPDRGRLGDRRRVRDRVLGHAVRVPVLRRVRERVHHLGAHDDAVLRGLERAVRLPARRAGPGPGLAGQRAADPARDRAARDHAAARGAVLPDPQRPARVAGAPARVHHVQRRRGRRDLRRDLPRARLGRRPAVVPAQGVHLRVHLRVDARHAARACASTS